MLLWGFLNLVGGQRSPENQQSEGRRCTLGGEAAGAWEEQWEKEVGKG